MVYASTLSEYQSVVNRILSIEKFQTNIHHIVGVEKMVSDMIIRIPSATSNQVDTSSSRSICHENCIFNWE